MRLCQYPMFSDIIEIHDPKLIPKPCVHGCMADQPRHSVIPLLTQSKKSHQNIWAKVGHLSIIVVLS